MATVGIEAGRVFETDENPLAFVGMEDPYPRYRELRAKTPVVWLRSLGVWGVFQDEMVRQVFNNHDRFTAAGGTGLPNYFREKQWKELGALESDPPDHTRLRAVLIRVLAPAALARLKDDLEQEAERLTSALVARGMFDGAADFAKTYVLRAFLDAVGVAEGDREKVLAFNDVIRKFRAAAKSEMTEADHAVVESFLTWEREFCSRTNMAPGSFGAQIYEAVDAGKIDEIEGNRLVRTFVAAGTGTTIAGLTQTLYYLAKFPEQWEVLRSDPGAARAAFDEALRFDAPAQVMARCAREDLEWEGARIAKHDKVLAFIGSANRDPERWTDPDAYLIKRGQPGHLGLGLGLHGCVGQMLARMQAEALIGALARKVESIEIDGPPVRNVAGLRGFQSIPISVRAI